MRRSVPPLELPAAPSEEGARARHLLVVTDEVAAEVCGAGVLNATHVALGLFLSADQRDIGGA